MKRFLIFVFILLTCSMFGQVKLRQLERDSIKFSVPTPKDQIIIAGDTSYSQRYIPGLAWLDSLGVSGVQDYYISNDTLYLTTTDSTYAVIVPTSEDIRVDTVVFGSLPFTPSANAGFTVIMSDGTEFPINFEGALDFLFNDVQLGVYTRNDMTFTKSGYDFVLNTYLTEDVAYPIRPKIYVSETEPLDTITDYPDYALFPGYLWKKPSTGEVWQLNQDMDWVLISDLIPEMGTVIDSFNIANDTAYIYLADTTLKAEITHPVNLDNDPTNELYDDTDINNRVDSVSNAILWEDMGTYIRDKASTKVSVSDAGRLGIGVVVPTATFEVNTTDTYPAILKNGANNLFVFNNSGDLNLYQPSFQTRIGLQRVANRPTLSFYDTNYASNAFYFTHYSSSQFNIGFSATGYDAIRIYNDDDVAFGNEVRIQDQLQVNDLTPVPDNLLGVSSTNYFGEVGLATDFQVNAGSLELKNNGAVYRIWHENEKKTLHTLVSDWENSWYLLNERWESTTNTCGLSDGGLFNNGDDLQVITDSCTFNLVNASTGNGRTYNNGEFYFVPYANGNIETTDSVKIRTKDRDNIWTTRYYGPFEIIDAGSDSYGRVVLSAQFNYVKEWEITYYGSVDLAGLEYYYYRANTDIPIASKMRSNTFYRNNTFLGEIGDQYFSFGTDGQVLKKDGTGWTWTDEYEFDSTGIYTYVDALDYWNRFNDTLINDAVWNRLQLDDYGNGMHNQLGNGVATINYDGTFNSTPLENFDIDRTNEYKLEDNLIEFISGTNFNFPEFVTRYGILMAKPIQIEDAVTVRTFNTLSKSSFSDIYMDGNRIYGLYNNDFYVYEWNGNNLNSLTELYFYDYNFNTQNSSFYVTGNQILFVHRATGQVISLNRDSIDMGLMPDIVIHDNFPYCNYMWDFGIKGDKWYSYELNQRKIYLWQFNDWLDFEGSTPIDTIDLPSNTSGIGSVEYYDEDKFVFHSTGTDSLYFYDIESGNQISKTNSWSNTECLFYYKGRLIGSEYQAGNSWYQIIIGEGRDTLSTQIPEILDTSNYYSYSIEIEGNNIDTVRTGIATWLDGNVSYNWCSGDTLYTGWHRFDLDFKATEHDSIKPVFVIADTTSIKNVRLFLKQYQAESFDDTSIHERIDSVITIFVTHDTNDADTVIGNEYNTTLTLVGTELQLTDGGGTLTQELSSFLDNTDTQGFDVATFTGGLLSLSLDNDGDTTHEFDFDARYLQSEVDGSVTNEGVLSMNTDLANVTFSVNSNSSGSVPMYFTEETAVSGNNRAVDLERSGNAITFNLKDADELETVTISAAADYFLVWDATDSDWKATTISNIPGDGTGTDDQGLVIVSAAAGTINTENSALGAIDLTSLIQQQVVQESTTVGTGFDLSGYQIVADFNEFTTDAIPEGDEFIIMYDVSGVTHEKIDIDDLATYIGSGELTTVGTGLSLAGYQVNPDFDAFTQDNTFSGTDEVVYLSFTTHKRGTLAGLGAYMQANWGDGTGTDDQAIYYYLSGSTPALRLDGTSTGMEFDAGEGLVSSGFEEGTLDRILYQHDWTEFNVLSSGVTTSDYLLVLDGTDEARMQISYLATLIGGADGNGLWNSSNSNTTMASGMEPRVNNYLLFESATEAPLFYIDDAATDFMAFKGTTALPHPVFGSADVSVHGTFGSSNDIFSQDDIRAGGDVIAGGWGVFGGFVSVGDLTEGPATGLVGYGSGNHLTNEITIGDNLEFTGSRLNVLTDAEEFYGADPTPSASDVNITMSGTRVSSGAGAGAVSGGNIVVATGLYLVTVSFYAEQGQGIVAVNTFTGSTSGQWPSVYYDVGSSKVSCSQSALVDVTASGTLTYEVDAISGTNEISQFEIIFIKLSD